MDLVGAIRDVVGIEASDRATDKIAYARDLWPRHHIDVRAGRVSPAPAAAVAWPESTEQVAALIRLCRQEGVSVVPYGAGSGVCGGVLPSPRTLVIDMKKMRRWRSFQADDGYLDVEAGALGIRLEEDLQAEGFTVGHFPSSILCSTVGGWLAARGAGQCSGLYGKIEDMVAGLEMVDGRGEVAWLQRRTEGPDLTPLVIGSEGILGVITNARLRLHPVPARRGYAAFSFPSMEAGWEAIRDLYQRGLRPAVCRLYDPFDSMLARRKSQGDGRPSASSSGAPLPAPIASQLLRFPSVVNAAVEHLGERVFGGAMLVLLFEGSVDRVDSELEGAREVARERDGEDLGETPARHWLERRYAVSYRQAAMFKMGAFVDTMEVAAPWSRLGALYDGVREALGQHAMVMAHMSHAYPDGCSIYFTFAGSRATDDEALATYDRAWRDALFAAHAAGGTIAHHHGVGRSKAPAMGAELGLGIEVVAAVRNAFDPDGILNPGNLLPPETPPRTGLAAAPAVPTVDSASGTVHAAGSHTLAAVEEVLAGHGLSLGLAAGADRDATVDAWLGAGAPGARDPWGDPVDQLVAGFSIALPSGAGLHLGPSPRRAVGPDLRALYFGTEGRAGRWHAAHLVAQRTRAAELPTPLSRNPAVGNREGRWLERTIQAAAEV